MEGKNKTMAPLPATEKKNSRYGNLDELSVEEVLAAINSEDKTVAPAVEKQLPQIACVVELACKAVGNGGRVIYCGCGTSGRLGVLDAAECPPTYGVEPGVFAGVIAGGEKALTASIEGAEDDRYQAEQDLAELVVEARDLVVGVAASGQTPYVEACLEYACRAGAATAYISCSPAPLFDSYARVGILVETGPEIVAGSTRMKAGTAQKMILNMISTATMVRMGRVYKNLMVDVRPVNEKLRNRARQIVTEATGCSEQEAALALKQAGMEVKTAVLMTLLKTGPEEARGLLAQHGGVIRQVLAQER